MSKAPDAFRTISEASAILGVPAHVLRFWESRFTQIRPVKRAGGRRYYRQADLRLLDGIRRLLHEDGLTIRGVQKLLREEGLHHVAALGAPELEDRPGEGGEDEASPPEAGAEALSPAPGDDEAPGGWPAPADPCDHEAPMAEDVVPAPEGQVLAFTPRFAHRGAPRPRPAEPAMPPDAAAPTESAAAAPPADEPLPPGRLPDGAADDLPPPRVPAPANGLTAGREAMPESGEPAASPSALSPAVPPVVPAPPTENPAAARPLEALRARIAALPPDPPDDAAAFALPALDLGRLPRDAARLQPLIARLRALRERMAEPARGG